MIDPSEIQTRVSRVFGMRSTELEVPSPNNLFLLKKKQKKKHFAVFIQQ